MSTTDPPLFSTWWTVTPAKHNESMASLNQQFGASIGMIISGSLIF
jgi:hypothetical protein